MKKTKKPVKTPGAANKKGMLVTVEKVRDLDTVAGGFSCMPTDATHKCGVGSAG